MTRMYEIKTVGECQLKNKVQYLFVILISAIIKQELNVDINI